MIHFAAFKQQLLKLLPWFLLILTILGVSALLYLMQQTVLETNKKQIKIHFEYESLQRKHSREQIEWQALSAQQTDILSQRTQQFTQQLKFDARQANQQAQYAQARHAAITALHIEADTETQAILYRAAQQGRAWQTKNLDTPMRTLLSNNAQDSFWLLAENGHILRWAWQAKAEPEVIAQGNAKWLLLDQQNRWLITSNAQHEILLLDTQDGTVLHRLVGHHADIQGAVLSADEQQLISYDLNHHAIVWQLGNQPQKQYQLTQHKAAITGAAFHPDGHSVVTISTDHFVRLWKLSTGKKKAHLQTILKGHQAALQHVYYSPNGHYIVSTDWENGMRLWSSKGRLVVHFPNADHAILHILISQDSQYLMTADSTGLIQIWTLKNGTLAKQQQAHDSAVKYLIQYGQQVLSADAQGKICLWDMKKLAIQYCLHEATGDIQALQFVQRGLHILAVSKKDNQIKLWRWHNRPHLRWLKHLKATDEKNQVIRSQVVAYHPQHAWLASGDSDAQIRLWDVRHGVLESALTGHDAAISALAFSADGERLASAAQHGIRIWDTKSLKTLKLLSAHDARINTLKFSPNKHYLLSYAADNTAIVWGLKHNKSKPQRLSGHESPILYADFSADREQVISVTQQAWRVWDLASHTLQHTQKQNHFTAAALHPLSAQLLTVHQQSQQQQQLCRWSISSPKQVPQCTPFASAEITAVTWHPAGHAFVSAGIDGTLQQWLINEADNTAALKAGIQFKGHRHWIQALDFSQQGEHLLSAGYDGSVRLWSWKQQQAWAILDNHTGDVRSAAFIQGHKGVFSLDQTGNLRVWQVFSDVNNLLEVIEEGY